MVAPSKLNEALQMVEALPAEDFGVLMEILKTREIEQWREEVRLAGIKAQAAYARGELKPRTIAQIMKEAKE